MPNNSKDCARIAMKCMFFALHAKNEGYKARYTYWYNWYSKLLSRGQKYRFMGR